MTMYQPMTMSSTIWEILDRWDKGELSRNVKRVSDRVFSITRGKNGIVVKLEKNGSTWLLVDEYGTHWSKWLPKM